MVDRILTLIKEAGISNNKLLSDLGLPGSAISEWKKGKAKPSVEALIKIADYFNVSVDYILGRANRSVTEIETNIIDIDETIQAYLQLDMEDKAEIRGIVKQMLKNVKYSAVSYSVAQLCVLKRLLKLYFEEKYHLDTTNGNRLFVQRLNKDGLEAVHVNMWLKYERNNLLDPSDISKLIAVTGYSLNEFLENSSIAFNEAYEDISPNVIYSVDNVFYKIDNADENIIDYISYIAAPEKENHTRELAAYDVDSTPVPEWGKGRKRETTADN